MSFDRIAAKEAHYPMRLCAVRLGYPLRSSCVSHTWCVRRP